MHSKDEELLAFGTKENALLKMTTHHLNGLLILMQQLINRAEETIEGNGNAHLSQCLNLLNASTESCLEIINILFEKEHYQSTAVTEEPLPLNIVEPIHFIYRNLVTAFPLRSISFDTVSPTIYVQVNKYATLQIVNNFVSNAIKFTPPDQPIAISIYKTESKLVISVKDEGIGIPEHFQPFLFKNRSAAGRIGLAGQMSHGCGLFISKILAESMNASIEYETRENEGSLFRLLIPDEE